MSYYADSGDAANQLMQWYQFSTSICDDAGTRG